MLEGPVMPSTLYPKMEKQPSNLEDQRALQVALELSMLSLNGGGGGVGGVFGIGDPTCPSDGGGGGVFDSAGGLTTVIDDNRTKRGQNVTEWIPVPSSDHVAEIVGRQGCKIKALRAKTNTYIKTPTRGEEPVFVVTGREEDVASAKEEILYAANHFSQIRAQRSKGGLGLGPVGGGLGGPGGGGGPARLPGHVTIPVKVPYKLVSLVVGPKGTTVRRIQQQTRTHITTPTRGGAPIFEVTGLPENCEMAKKEVYNYILARTGNSPEMDEYADYPGVSQKPTQFISNLFDKGFNPISDVGGKPSLSMLAGPRLFYSHTKNLDFSSLATALSAGGRYEVLECNENWRVVEPAAPGKAGGGVGVGDSGPGQAEAGHPPARRFHSDPAGADMRGSSGLGGSERPRSESNGSSSPSSSSAAAASVGDAAKSCLVCFDSPIAAALIPCGHNLFCFECAQRICKADGVCPICEERGQQAIRIQN